MTTADSKLQVQASSDELVKKGQKYYMPNYKPREMILDHGKGATVWDLDGNDYVDFSSGIAVSSLGHQDDDLKRALEDQVHKLWHTSNVFFTEPPIRLAEALVNSAPFARKVYFCNSGAEANEAAIKIARKYAADQGKTPEQREIITFNGSFHGRTLATVTATAQPKYHQGFEPLPGGFTYCEHFNDEDAITRLVSENTCAIIVEPVQGEGGVVPAKPGFLKHLRKLCDDFGALLIFDEIQCGVGRTGTLYAHTQDEVEPDIMTLAKALGCGFPIGATLVGEKAQDTLQLGTHGSTFGGNPVSCAVALAGLEKISNPVLLEQVKLNAQQFHDELDKINDELHMFADIRGRGLMIGAELKEQWHGKAGAISEQARMQGLLVLVAGPNVVRFLPPLTVNEDEIKEGFIRFRRALDSFLQEERRASGDESSSSISLSGNKVWQKVKMLWRRIVRIFTFGKAGK